MIHRPSATKSRDEAEITLNLNEFIFRDDTAETLAAEVDDDFDASEDRPGTEAPAKAGLAALLGMSSPRIEA